MNQLLNHRIIGEGQPLIILHGLFGSLDNWLTLGKRFSKFYQLILVDQRNHGKSFHSPEFDYTAMADDLDHLIDELNLKEVMLLGHSMGGKTVMQFAAFHPDKVDKIVVADIGPKQYPVHHQTIIDALKSVPLSQVKNREDVEISLSKLISEVGVRTFLMKNLKRNSDGGFSWKMNLKDITDNIEEVGKELDYYLPIDKPIMFIRGGESNYILDDDYSDIEEIFPEASFTTVENAGHWLHADQPDVFFDKVIDFLKS